VGGKRQPVADDDRQVAGTAPAQPPALLRR
jgi:hypothetical protein